MRYLTVKLDKFAIEWAKNGSLKSNQSRNMSTIEEQSKGRKEGEIRYLTPLNITPHQKNIADLKDWIKYIDYKDPDFLINFVNGRKNIEDAYWNFLERSKKSF